MKNNNILVIGDCHIDDEQDLSRFNNLGNYILETMPQELILIGDFLSLNCFSAWDVNKRALMENRRRQAEIEAGREALQRMLGPTMSYNFKRKKSKKNHYKPRIVYLGGNHEDRERRYLEQKPELIGSIDYFADLGFSMLPFEVLHVPYREYYYYNGVGFTHIPMNKMNAPISGARIMRTALDLHAHSVVFGHTHELRIDGEHRHGAEHFNQVLNCGCFFEHTQDYSRGAKHDDWRGIIELDMYSHNRFDINTVSLSRLKTEY